MTALDRLVPGPHVLEIDRIDVAAPAARVWERVRHGELAHSLPIRALFAMRGLASGQRANLCASSTFRIEDLKSTVERPGFQILVDDLPHEMPIAAIGKVWRLDIPFTHVANADEYAVVSSNDLITRLSFGPTFVEAIGFAMDRRMLLGVKQRAEAAPRRVLAA